MTFIVVGIDGGGIEDARHRGGRTGRDVRRDGRSGERGAARRGRASANVIADVVRDALASCEMTHVTPRALCVGVAGAGRETERQELWQALVEPRSGDGARDPLRLQHRARRRVRRRPRRAAHQRHGFGGVRARPDGRDGALRRLGPVCGDEGSGAWIGRRALSRRHRGGGRARAGDGAHGRDSHRGGGQRDDASSSRGPPARTPAQLATLAPVVLAVADSGDLRANALLSLAVEELVLHVRALARQLFGDERAALPVALVGRHAVARDAAPKAARAPPQVGGARRADPNGAGDPGARRGARGAAHRRRGDGLGRRVGRRSTRSVPRTRRHVHA